MNKIFGSRLTAAQFLKDYWQKKPVLFRGAFPNFQDPVDENELAAIAMEEGAHARLIREREGKKLWTLRKGPFDEQTLRTLPDRDWTLLVSKMEKWSDAAAKLLDEFSFVPHWRCDDLMASFAPVGGTVGPHVDSYDVFLIQGQGSRRWQIAERYKKDLVPDVAVKVLKNFEAEDEWILETGDMLYLPPGVAHYGVALENCMTWSVGFRAPSQRMLAGNLLNISDTLLNASKASDELYADPDLKLQSCPGEISPQAVHKVRAMLEPILNDQDLLARWFGTFLSFPDPGQVPERPKAVTTTRAVTALQKGRTLVRSDIVRLYYTRSGKKIAIFAGGEEYLADTTWLPFLKKVSARRFIPGAEVLSTLPKGFDETDSVFLWLLRTGALYFDR